MNEKTIINQLSASIPQGLAFEGLVVPAMGTNSPDSQGILTVEGRDYQVAIEVKYTGGTASFREGCPSR